MHIVQSPSRLGVASPRAHAHAPAWCTCLLREVMKGTAIPRCRLHIPEQRGKLEVRGSCMAPPPSLEDGWAYCHSHGQHGWLRPDDLCGGEDFLPQLPDSPSCVHPPPIFLPDLCPLRFVCQAFLLENFFLMILCKFISICDRCDRWLHDRWRRGRLGPSSGSA